MTPTPARPGASLRIRFDGSPLPAVPGESVAAALVAAGRLAQSRGKDDSARGHYCGMGVCHECLVIVDGRAGQRACLTKVGEGQRVETQASRLDLRDGGLADLASLPDAIPEEGADLLVVGAGPGGLAAAQGAAALGARVVVIDERPAPGGQFFKQAQSAPAHGFGPDAQMREGAALIAHAGALGVDIRGETLVWGAERSAEGGLVVATFSGGKARRYRPRLMVIATGGFEEPSAVPGWTLPGVMTTGAAQTLLRSYGVVAGRRVVVAGNGPLNLQVAGELVRAGAEVVAIADRAPSPFTRPAEASALLRAHPGLALAGILRIAALRRAGVAVEWDAELTRIEGEGSVAAAVLRTGDGERRVEADAVLVGDGFAPANELSRLLGCVHREVDGRLHVERGEDGATSLADVFVVGEAGRFAGAHVAGAQGRLAGREAARRLGLAVPAGDEDKRDRRTLRRHEAFQRALWTLFAAPTARSEPDEGTLACRCEAVSFGALAEAAAEGAPADIATLKRLTRAGMGRCQSRYCGPALSRALKDKRSAASSLAPQMPLRPVPLAALALEKPEWGGHRRALLPESRAEPVGEPLPPLDVGTLVIGAGIAGLSTALFLAKDGEDVAVLERGAVNSGASGGNAGSLHAQLLSFDYGARAEAGGGPAAKTLSLQRDSIRLWQALEEELGADFEIRVTGGLMVAETQAHLRFLDEKTALERAQGIDSFVIGADELRRLEPALSECFVGAAHCPQEGKINPLVATQGVRRAAERAGAQLFEGVEVQALERETSGRWRVETTRGVVFARRIVNAAGAFASRVGAMADLEVPVFGAPLQMVVTEALAPLVSRLVAHAGRHLTLKQAANGNVIIGGGWTAALDPVHRHPRPLLDSLEGNLWVAQHVVPALRKAHVIRSWAAMNINIDGAPILGEHPGAPGFFNAVTSNGYTLGPLVGQITAALVTRGDAGRDIETFSVSRFAKGRP